MKERPELTNGDLAELLARAAEEEAGHRRRALLTASRRAAFSWPEEAADLMAEGRSLTELTSVGPWVARIIDGWFDDPPEPPELPEVRRGFLTLADVRSTLDQHPDWSEEIRADLQMHTTYSDGKASLREMVSSAAALGLEYVAITDVVLGAFHSALRVEEDQTERYVAAMRNPTVNTLAHPRGRRYGVRGGLRADWPRVFAVAAELDKAVEIDAHPDRQDLDVELLELAREAGVRISIGTDAHSTSELRFMEYGLAAAIRAGIPHERILNFQSREDVLAWAVASRGLGR